MNKDQVTALGHSRKTHGMRQSRVYGIFTDMHSRCYNPSVKHYERYGGRGVAVCERWYRNFEMFFADMGEPPTKTHTLERIDNTKGYSPENCTWATPSEQARNTRRNIIVVHQGTPYILQDALKKFGIPAYMISNRRTRKNLSAQVAFDQVVALYARGKNIT
jgi:hypothetical protein